MRVKLPVTSIWSNDCLRLRTSNRPLSAGIALAMADATYFKHQTLHLHNSTAHCDFGRYLAWILHAHARAKLDHTGERAYLPRYLGR